MRLEKLGNSFHCVEIRGYTVYFSYETPIGVYCSCTNKTILSENEWGNTTGKHLNLIDRNKFNRIPHSELVENMKEIGIW